MDQAGKSQKSSISRVAVWKKSRNDCRVQFKDYYAILEVKRDASQDDIRKAFRKLARVYHPDVAKDKSTAEAKFKEINEAYEVVGDPEKRKKYDALGANWDQPGGGYAPQHPRRGGGAPGGPQGDYEFEFGGTGFSDFFETFFGGGRGGTPEEFYGTRTAGRSSNRPGRDLEASILLTLDEVVNGSTRVLTLRRPETGDQQTINVKIPIGIGDGERIRVRGKGDPSPGSGAAGDLYLTVKYSKHPDFEVDGADLLAEAVLSAPDAVLGTTHPVNSLGGTLKLKIPAGSQPGNKLRLRGKGLPRRDGTHGDLIVALQITLPKTLTDTERRLWTELAGQS